jgi:Rps23 Pro-64 3,4-dihydroxylase Tpa1-like proline 4-hydroxylase
MTLKIHQIKNPFPFLQIENLYSEDELILIWKEFDFLTHPDKLELPENTGTALDEETKVPLKKNKGLFLDNLYSSRNISNILTITKQLFSPVILDAFSELSFGYENIKDTNKDATLLSYYENSEYYKSHKDQALYTAVSWFFKEPKSFSGGNFYFTNYGVKIEVQNNMAVIFPSFINHAVDEIVLEKNNNLTGYGRYAISQFLYITDEK